MQGLRKTAFTKAPATEKIWRGFGRASDCRQGAVSKWLKQAMRGSAFITASSSPIRVDDFRQTKKLSILSKALCWCGRWDWILAARRRSVSAVLKPHRGLIHYGFFKSHSR